MKTELQNTAAACLAAVTKTTSFSTIPAECAIADFMLKAILFDFNGVIVNDEPLHLELFRRVLAEEGLTVTDDEYQGKYLGREDRYCFRLALHEAGRTTDADLQVEQLTARKSQYYLAAVQTRDLLFPGVAELVRRLSAAYPLAIFSGALPDEIEAVLARGGIRQCFRVILTAEDVSAGKPDPEGYLAAALALNVPPSECLVIEDSVAGVTAAKRAGMHCLAVTSSYPAQALQDADWVVECLTDGDPAELFRAL